MAGIVLSRPLFDIQMPRCTNARPSSCLYSGRIPDAAVASSGTCHCYPEWHNFPVSVRSYTPSA